MNHIQNEILKILVLSNYADKFPLKKDATFKEVEAYKQDAFDYYLGKFEKGKIVNIPIFDIEQNTFHNRIMRDAAFIIEVIKNELEKVGY